MPNPAHATPIPLTTALQYTQRRPWPARLESILVLAGNFTLQVSWDERKCNTEIQLRNSNAKNEKNKVAKSHQLPFRCEINAWMDGRVAKFQTFLKYMPHS